MNLSEWCTLMLHCSPELLVQLAVISTAERTFATRVIFETVGAGGCLVPTGRALGTSTRVLSHPSL